MRWSFMGLAVLSVVTVTVSAAAQTPAKDGNIEIYEFKDPDKLVTSGRWSADMTIVAREGPVRVLLSRPRTHFVPELLKTIESL